MPGVLGSEWLDASEELFIDRMAFRILYLAWFCMHLFPSASNMGKVMVSAWIDIFHRSPPVRSCLSAMIIAHKGGLGSVWVWASLSIA